MIYMFNNFERIDENEFAFINHTTRELCIVELIVEQIHATSFDDIYTMHVYQSQTNENKFIVDASFEFHTNKMMHDEIDDENYELMHNFDVRVNIDISHKSFDANNVCNTIEFVEHELIYRDAYITRTYV